MNTSASEMRDWAYNTLHYLAKSPHYRTLTKVKEEAARLSGVSYSRIEKFSQGYQPNVTVETLDKLTGALREMLREAS